MKKIPDGDREGNLRHTGEYRGWIQFEHRSDDESEDCKDDSECHEEDGEEENANAASAMSRVCILRTTSIE